MSNGFIPKVGDRGAFKLKTPWVITQQGDFTCHAVRSFTELSKNGVDVYKTFYLPKGVSEEQYRTDSASGVVLVCLRSSTGTFIYVPSSYILGVPDGNGYAYSQRILTVELGPLPIDLSTEAIRSDIAALVNKRFGVNPVVAESDLPISEIVTPENHQALEAGRRGRISEQGNIESLYQDLLVAHTQTQQELKVMTDMLIELGVIVI